MKNKFRYAWGIPVLVVAALSLSCGTQNPGGLAPGTSATVDVHLMKSSLAAQVTRVLLGVAIDGTTVHTDDVAVQDGTFQFAAFELPAGNAVFSLQATNNAGEVLYDGDTTVTIIAGGDIQLSIELIPAVPMIKLSPFYSEVAPGGGFFSTLELFNIDRFYSGSFAIHYDPTLISFAGTITQVGTAWGDLVAFVRDVGDTVILSVTRTTINDDSVPAGNYSLVRLGFTALAGGETELQLICNRIEDFHGPIAERQVLRCDPQTIAIIGAETVPPALIGDLRAGRVTSTSIQLLWTAPGNDGQTGTAAQYDLRYSASPITGANWHAATRVANMSSPSPAGATDSMIVPGLEPATTYYFCVRSADHVPNWSPLSNLLSAITLAAPDTIPPASVTDLRVTSVTTTSAALTWTAPGDDGVSGGNAAQYELRYASWPITQSNWTKAIQAVVDFTPGAPGTSEHFTVTGLQPNTMYYFALRTADEVPHWSAISNTASAPMADGAPPAMVDDLEAVEMTGSSVKLQWTTPGDDSLTGTADVYDVRYSLAPITQGNWATAIQAEGEPQPDTAGSVQSFTLADLQSETTYYIGIRTADEVPNWSAVSNIVSATTLDGIAPAAIMDLATGEMTDSTIALHWTAPGDDEMIGTAAQYDLRYSTTPITATNWANAITIAGEPLPSSAGTSQGFTVAGLLPQTQYYFALQTADEALNWSGLSNIASATTLTPPDSSPPSAIDDLAVADISDSSVTLMWTAPGDDGGNGEASFYDLRYSAEVIDCSNYDFAAQVFAEPEPGFAGSPQNFEVAGLLPGTTYYFAIKTADETLNWSDLSNIVSAMTSVPPDTIPPLGIADLAVGGVTDSSAFLTWTAPGDDGSVGTALAYDVRYSIEPIKSSTWNSRKTVQAVGEPPPAAANSTENFTLTGLQKATTYYIAIKTLDNDSNWSETSNVVCCTTGAWLGYVGLMGPVPAVHNMTFDYEGSVFDAALYTPPQSPHWYIFQRYGFVKFIFSGQHQFSFNAAGPCVDGVSNCHVNVQVNGKLLAGIDTIQIPWQMYTLDASVFATGMNWVSITYLGTTPFWIDFAGIK